MYSSGCLIDIQQFFCTPVIGQYIFTGIYDNQSLTHVLGNGFNLAFGRFNVSYLLFNYIFLFINFPDKRIKLFINGIIRIQAAIIKINPVNRFYNLLCLLS